MSERRKQLEAERASTPVTPTKPRLPDRSTWTPVKIRGKRTPPMNPWATVRTPENNVAQRGGRATSVPPRAMSVPPQPLKGILKTPERKRAEEASQKKSSSRMYSTTSISWRGDTKKGDY